MSEVKDLLVQILDSEFANKFAMVGEVVSVTGNNITITNLEGGAQYSNVRLQAHPGNGVLIIPKVGSFVIVGRLTGNAGYVAMVSDADSIQLMDGSFGGLVKVDELVTKLNTLEERMTAHQHTYIPGTAPTVPTTTDPLSNPDIVETTSEELENPDITHGTIS